MLDAPLPMPGIQAFFPRPATPRPRIRRAEGIWFEDVDGKRYLDASSGPVVSNLGHGNKRVLQAMAEQAEACAFAFPMQWESEANIRLSERLAELAGPGLERAFLASGGSEAVETALKFSRQWAVVSGQEQRWKVIGRDPGYHGGTLGALSVTGDHAMRKLYGPMMRPMPLSPTPFTYRVPPNHTPETYARHCLDALDALIRAEGPETVLACIVEPIGGLATGALVPPDFYFGALREICTRHDVLLIFDEVISGAGRTGKFLAAHHWPEAKPDLVVLAKGVTAGYTPLGAVLAPAHMADAVAGSGGFAHGFTYFANPLSCAVGAAVLDELVERDLMGNAARMGAVLREKLDALAARTKLIGDIRGRGLLLAIELVAHKTSKAMIPLPLMAPYRLQALGLRHGIALYCRRTAGGAYGDWIPIAPPLTITEAEVDELIARLEATLREYEAELQGEGVL
ncbi:MAG: aspartate aminotransferase family protein [Acetobacteraceae bacterium]|nr:aspartate aminotransferase family protein [Acetobacteraceae bacterium]